MLVASQTQLANGNTDGGKFVGIKKVRRNGHESRIAQMLSTKELREDHRIHCVPVIEVIDDPDRDTSSYLVTPLLGAADSPPFQYVREIMDFVDQILQVRTSSL